MRTPGSCCGSLGKWSNAEEELKCGFIPHDHEPRGSAGRGILQYLPPDAMFSPETIVENSTLLSQIDAPRFKIG